MNRTFKPQARRSEMKKVKSLDEKLTQLLDDAVDAAKEHPIRSAIVALIVVFIIKKLIQAVKS